MKIKYLYLIVILLLLFSCSKSDIENLKNFYHSIKYMKYDKLNNTIIKNDLIQMENILKKRIDFNLFYDLYGITVIELAFFNGSKDAFELLLRYGADINQNKKKPILLQVAEINSGPVFEKDLIKVEDIKFLIKHGASINVKNFRNETPLSLFCDTSFLNKKYDKNINNLEIIKTLVENGAEINVENEDGNNKPVLRTAFIFGKLEVCEYLLDNGADINYMPSYSGIDDKYTMSILMDLAKYGRYEKLKFAINRGANLNLQNEQGKTALILSIENYCCAKNNIFCIKYLINSGADINILDNNNMTALDSAINKGYSDIIKLLKQNGAKTGKELNQ